MTKKRIKQKKLSIKSKKKKDVKKKLKKVKKAKTRSIKKKVAKKVVITEEAKLVKPLSKAKALALLEREDSKNFIINLAGQEGFKIYKFLVNARKEIDEFTLADKVSLQINFVRSLLYKLYEQKLVSFSRERDKKKGWFIYSWQAHPERLKYILLGQKEEEIAKLEKQLATSQDTFFCTNCNKSYDYIHAMETMFFCEVCGNKLETISSLEVKDKIKKQIAELKAEIEKIKKI